MSDPRQPDSALRANAAVPLDEHALVDRLRAGDAVAFERVFRHYYPALCTFAARLVGSETLAEDLVQDVFRRLWDRRAGWAIQTTVNAYLYRATRNRVLDHLKHRRIADTWAESGDAERAATSVEPAPDELLYAAELNAAIVRVAEALPDRCRQAFFLKWTHGLTYTEIAEIMGISVKTVEMQMSRAYKALRDRLQQFLP